MQLPLINNHFKGYSEVSNVNYKQFLLHLPDVSHSLRSIFYLCTNSPYLRCSFCSVWSGNWNLPLWMPESSQSFPYTNGQEHVLIFIAFCLYHDRQFNLTQTLFVFLKVEFTQNLKCQKIKEWIFINKFYTITFLILWNKRYIYDNHFSLLLLYNCIHGIYISSINLLN